MGDILKTNQKILKGLLYLNVIFLIVSIFYVSKATAIPFYIVNIILVGTHLIIKRNYLLLQRLSTTNKVFKHLNNMGSS